MFKQHSQKICTGYNLSWGSWQISKILLDRQKKGDIFGASEQKAVVVYIGGFRHQSWCWEGGGENNGVHIFHCISIALFLLICSVRNWICLRFLIVFIHIYIEICVDICIYDILYCRGCGGVRENNGPKAGTHCLHCGAKLVTVTLQHNPTLHTQPLFPIYTHFLKTHEQGHSRWPFKQKPIVVCSL